MSIFCVLIQLQVYYKCLDILYNNPEIHWDTHLKSIGTSISLRTLQIPGRTFRRKQVDQPRPPSSSLHSLALADWGPWSLRSSPAASRLGNNWTLTTSWMGIPAFWWESQAGCLNAGRDTPTSPRGNPLKIYLPSVYRRKLRTREPTECASRWVGRGELGKFQPSILKRKTSSVSKFLGAGGRLPWKRAGTRVREGKSWRGVRKASRWTAMSKLPALSLEN